MAKDKTNNQIENLENGEEQKGEETTQGNIVEMANNQGNVNSNLREAQNGNKEVDLNNLNQFLNQIDGYLTKPINLSKITSALSNALERYQALPSIKFENGSEYFPLEKKLVYKNEIISLGNKEHLLLHYMLKNSHKMITKDEIASNVWIYEDMSDSAQFII